MVSIYEKRTLNQKNILMVLLLLMINVWGCGAPYLKLTLSSAEKLNPDDSGNALPVVVRLYQLADKAAIEKADFSSLWENDKELLGNDIVTREEITLFPSSNMTMKFNKDPKTYYLGVVSFFRKPSGESWRYIINLSQSKTHEMQLSLSEYDIKLSEHVKKADIPAENKPPTKKRYYDIQNQMKK